MTKVKDLPVGILVMVVAFFPLFAAYWLANSPPIFTWMGVVLGVIIYNAIFSIGWKIAFEGIKVDDNKE